MIKNDFLERRHEVEKLLEERDNPNADKSRHGRITFKVREGITDMTSMVDRMILQVQEDNRKVTMV